MRLPLGGYVGIKLLLAANTGLEAFPKSFVEGGGMGFLFYTAIKC